MESVKGGKADGEGGEDQEKGRRTGKSINKQAVTDEERDFSSRVGIASVING